MKLIWAIEDDDLDPGKTPEITLTYDHGWATEESIGSFSIPNYIYVPYTPLTVTRTVERMTHPQSLDDNVGIIYGLSPQIRYDAHPNSHDYYLYANEHNPEEGLY